MKIFTHLLVFCITATAAMGDSIGLRIEKIELPHHNKSVEIAIWYPTDETERTVIYAENPVFRGVKSQRDASLRDGSFPLVFISHGNGGADKTMASLASAIARRGAIAVALNHPNSTWRDYDMSKGIHHWTRVLDMQRALDHVLAHPDFASAVDMDRIMALGFSYGGWTALSIGGLRGNHFGFVSACERLKDVSPICDQLLSQHINVQGVDPKVWNDTYKDKRITHVFAIFPALVWGLIPTDTPALTENRILIGLGDKADRLVDTDFDASGLAQNLSPKTMYRLVPATHFSAMPLCKPQGAAILAAEKDDPVCTDPVGADRSKIHKTIIDHLAQTLDLK